MGVKSSNILSLNCTFSSTKYTCTLMSPWVSVIKMMSSLMLLLLIITNSSITIVQAQQQDPLIYTITENDKNTQIGDLVKDYKLDLKYSQGQINNLSFVFIEKEQDLSYLFVTPITEGLLKVKSPIDRDNICANLESCIIHLDIKIQPSQYFEIIKIEVVVEDLNDNEPMFSMVIENINVIESAPIGTLLTLPQAVDADSPAYGIQRYEIGNSNTFRLLQDTSMGTRTVQLELLEGLDREKYDLYSLQLKAFDGGENNSTLDIIINVLDSNDNSPIFVNGDNFIVSVNESIPVGSPVFQVKAEDKDMGPNGIVTYTFDSNTATVDGQLFRIDENTGYIFIKSGLDYETKSQHMLSVLAHDNDPDFPRSTTARVTINVQDINDNRPSIKINDYTEGTSLIIPENYPSDSFVAHLTVTDIDSGNNGKFDCNIDGNGIEDFKLERLYTTDFKITTAKSFDRETKGQYTLQITCQDNGTPSLLFSKLIPIQISDINDVIPKFTTTTFVANALESMPVGSFIMRVSAIDSDLGLNGQIKYNISDGNNQFNIDIQSGNITLRTPLDREIEDRIQFFITAVDKGIPALTSTATVIINVKDEDDNIPVFLEENTDLSVFENELPSTDVGQVVAVDIDSKFFNQFTYDMEINDFFTIDPYSGVIKTKLIIDREVNPVFRFNVFAVSSTLKSNTSTASVTIEVTDRNDNKPVIQFPSSQNNTVHISNSLTRGEIVTYIQATDLDQGKNSLLTFMVTGGNSENYFVIDSNIGAVMVHKSLTDIALKSFGLIIKVQDNALPPLTAETYLNIVVNKSLSLPRDDILETRNLSIAISIACISGLIIVILMVAIAMILRQRVANSKARMYNYAPKVLDRNVFLHNNKQQKNSSSSMNSVLSVTNEKEGITNLGLDSTDSNVQNNHQVPGLHAKPVREQHRDDHNDSDSGCSDADTDSGRGSNEDSHEQIRHPSDSSYNQYRQQPHPGNNQHQPNPDLCATTKKQSNPLYGVPHRQTSLSWQQLPNQDINSGNIYTKKLPVGTTSYNNPNTSRDSGHHSYSYGSDTRLENPVHDHIYIENRRRDLLYREHGSPKSSSNMSQVTKHNSDINASNSSDQYLKLSQTSKPNVFHEVHV